MVCCVASSGIPTDHQVHSFWRDLKIALLFLNYQWDSFEVIYKNIHNFIEIFQINQALYINFVQYNKLMKQIPRKVTTRGKTRQSGEKLQPQKQQVQNNDKEKALAEVPKTKKIHHQTLKAMQRRRLAEQKLAKQLEEAEKQAKENKNKDEVQKQEKVEQSEKQVKVEKQVRKLGRPCKKKPKIIKKEQLKNVVVQEKTENNKKNQIQEDQVNMMDEEKPEEIKQVKARGRKPLNKTEKQIVKKPIPVSAPEFPYYQKHFQEIFNVLKIPQVVEQQCFIFDKNRPQQYAELLAKIKNSAAN